MFERAPNGFFVRNLIVFNLLRRGGFVSKGFVFEAPDLTNSQVADLNDFQDQLCLLLASLHENQRLDYGSPLIVNADWGAVWWDGRIKTNVNARYRGEFEIIDDTGANISVGGTTYDVYEKVKYDPSVDFNLNATADIVRGKWGTVTLDARVDNLLDSIPYKQSVATSQPYQLGRTVWLGMKYRF